MTPNQLTHWLSRFVVEVRKLDGTEYPPNTLYHICAGIQRSLRDSGLILDIFKDPQYSPFQNSLDREMKQGWNYRVQDEPFSACDLHQQVVSVRRRRATRHGEDWSSQSDRRSFLQTYVGRAA